MFQQDNEWPQALILNSTEMVWFDESAHAWEYKVIKNAPRVQDAIQGANIFENISRLLCLCENVMLK